MSSGSAQVSPSVPETQGNGPVREPARRRGSVNRELWLLLAIFAIAAAFNLMVDSQRMILGLYTLPTIFSAYMYGRRHAVLTACGSAFLVVLLKFLNPSIMGNRLQIASESGWFDIAIWAGILAVTAYAMGTLYERKEQHLRDLRQSYEGILMILQHIASDNKYSQNHPYRVATAATKIAEQMGLGSERVEDVRAAALLHEVDKVGISREILYEAANVSQKEIDAMEAVARSGATEVKLEGGALRRIIPIILSYHAGFERAEDSRAIPKGPLEVRILMVADVYDSLTSAKTSRISPSEAMERIVQRSGVEYDPEVVDAMVKVFRSRGMGPQTYWPGER